MLKPARHAMNPSRRRLLRLAAGCAALCARHAARAQTAAIEQRPIPGIRGRLPIVGIGTWHALDVGAKAPERVELGEVLRRFAGHGGRVLDSSPMYGQAERVVGDL